MEGGLWAATDVGILRVDENVGVVDRDLPSRSAYALAESPAGLWVGTAGGVAMLRRFAQAGVVVEEVLQTAEPVLSLVAEGHDVWIGTAGGLRFLPGTGESIVSPTAIQRFPIASESITALEIHDDQLFVATPSRVMWRSPDSTWTEATPLVNVGNIRAIAGAERGSALWIGGSDGLVWFDHQTNASRTVVTDRELPGEITDVQVGGGFVWVATSGGLVRLRTPS